MLFEFFPGKKLIGIFFSKYPMFQKVTQGFSDTGSRALENRDPESLQQLLAIKTPVQPRGEWAVGSGATATDAFGHPSLTSSTRWSCLIAAHNLLPKRGQYLEHFKAPSPSETPCISDSQLLSILPPRPASDALLGTERSRVRLLCCSLEKQPSPTTQCEAKRIKCQPGF